LPSISISPEVGIYSRAINCPSVLFPDPLSPITKVISPAGKKRLTEFNMGLSGWDEYVKES
jgi:hypothetical protein